MTPIPVPTDVAAALAHAGYRPIEVRGAAWLAEPLDGSDQRIELHVLPAVADAPLAERAARLCAVRHEHLPLVLDVVELHHRDAWGSWSSTSPARRWRRSARRGPRWRTVRQPRS